MKKDFELEFNGMLVFIFSIIAAALNYLYQLIMGNLLSPTDFGMLNTVLSLTIVAAIPSAILQMVVAKFSAHFDAKKENNSIVYIFWTFLFIGVGIAICIMVVGLFLAQSIGTIFKIHNTIYIKLIFLSAGISFLVSVINGFLQGKKQFLEFSLTTVVATIVKLVSSTVLVFLGYNIAGNITALILSNLGVIVFVMIRVRKIVFSKYTKPEGFNFAEVIRYSKSILLIQLLTIFFNNGDILVMRMFISDTQEIGYYSYAIVLGKISLFVASAVVSVLFGIVAQRRAKNESTIDLFFKAIFYGGGSAVACALILNLFAEPILRISFGEQSILAAPFFAPIGFFLIALVLVTIIINYQSAVADVKFISLTLVIACGIMLVSIILLHETISQILYIMGVFLMLTAVVNILRNCILHYSNLKIES